MHFITSLAVAASAAVVAASPIEASKNVIKVPLTRINTATSAKNVLIRDQARLNKVNGGKAGFKRSDSGSITNEVTSYVASVNIGGTDYSLIVDTGSSNTWCGAQNSCEPSNSGVDTGNSVSVNYGDPENPSGFSGEEYIDQVAFGGATVTSQSIAAATSSSNFNGVDGIIGFGPVDLTEDTVSNTNTVPTFMDNLKSQGTISTEVLGVFFQPDNNAEDDTNGELTLGGTDSSKYTGSITYFPKLTSGDASYYWGISVAEFSYGSTNLGSSSQAIVDTGTTLILLPTSVYNNFLSATGGTTNSDGFVQFSQKPTSNLNFKFGSTTFSLTPTEYLLSSTDAEAFGFGNNYVAWIGEGSSSGVTAVIGQKFIESVYAVFDTTHSRIGFAKAA